MGTRSKLLMGRLLLLLLLDAVLACAGLPAEPVETPCCYVAPNEGPCYSCGLGPYSTSAPAPLLPPESLAAVIDDAAGGMRY